MSLCILYQSRSKLTKVYNKSLIVKNRGVDCFVIIFVRFHIKRNKYSFLTFNKIRVVIQCVEIFGYGVFFFFIFITLWVSNDMRFKLLGDCNGCSSIDSIARKAWIYYIGIHLSLFGQFSRSRDHSPSRSILYDHVNFRVESCFLLNVSQY